MRVIAGTARGRRLKTVRSLAVRPTSDRVRESLFNVLAPLISGAGFLDLFAGSGAVAIEALSRGAGRAVLVEQNPRHLRISAENLADCGLGARAELLCRDVLRAVPELHARGERFDLVFMDPPYGTDYVARTLLALGEAGGLLGAGARVIAEHHRRDEVPRRAGSLCCFREIPFGETILSFFAAAAEAEALL